MDGYKYIPILYQMMLYYTWNLSIFDFKLSELVFTCQKLWTFGGWQKYISSSVCLIFTQRCTFQSLWSFNFSVLQYLEHVPKIMYQAKKSKISQIGFFCTFSYHDVLPCAFLQSAFVFLLGNHSEFPALSADCYKKGNKIAASVRFHFKSEKTNCNCKIMTMMMTLVMVRSYWWWFEE